MKQPLLKIVLFVLGVQAVVFYGYWILYETISFSFMPIPQVEGWIRNSLIVLGFSFVVLQLLVNKWSSRFLNFFYKIAAAWLGTMHFLFMACIIFWAVALSTIQMGALPPFPVLGGILFGLALALSAYSLIRSFRPRYTRYYIEMHNLPSEWRGRKAILVSDVHLGNIRGEKTTEKIVKMINAEKPDIVFIPGDLFDGPPADYMKMAAPLSKIVAPHGVYFSEGNHEEFHDPTPYLDAIRAAGVKILNKEMVVVDHMQILGIPYHSSNEPEDIRISLGEIDFNPEKPSILLKHAPSAPRAVQAAGISLMLSGHTHSGQMWPYNYLVKRLFGRAGYGHSQSSSMQVITTSGFGTWGPPQRFGTKAEIVVIKFK